MEPALDERGDRRGPATAAHRTAAAMEPALDERGDLAGNVARLDPGAAAMEPALDERGDQAAVPMWIAEVEPQWSPLSTSGATVTPEEYADIEEGAAMEPALDERGDTSGGSSPARRAMPQWSPLSTSGATNRQIHLVGDLVGPQWSP